MNESIASDVTPAPQHLTPEDIEVLNKMIDVACDTADELYGYELERVDVEMDVKVTVIALKRKPIKNEDEDDDQPLPTATLHIGGEITMGKRRRQNAAVRSHPIDFDFDNWG